MNDKMKLFPMEIDLSTKGQAGSPRRRQTVKRTKSSIYNPQSNQKSPKNIQKK